MTSRFAPSATDVETGTASSGLMTRSPNPRRPKRRPWASTMPGRIALSFGLFFLVFLLLGMLRASNRGRNAGVTSKTPAVDSTNTGQPNLFTFSVVAEYDHDPKAFTQGFEVYQREQDEGRIEEPTFIESTGLRGQSTVREVAIATGEVIRSTALADQDFGEGITRLGSRLYQVTWQGPKMISYDVNDFSDKTVMSTHLKDGWGITNDGVNLIVGDSTHSLYFIDPKTTKTVKKIDVTDDGKPVTWLNELEWVDGLIYANIWQKECIVQIEPNTGNVVGWVDLSGIIDKVKTESSSDLHHGRIDVLNGIAWDEVDSKLYITGKLWPKVYEIELRPLYVDSRSTNVEKMTASIRRKCIL